MTVPAQYGSLQVLELSFPQTSVMRRIDTDFVNLTQILLLAGVPLPDILPTLESEFPGISTSLESKTTEIDGCWAPLSTAIELAKWFGVYNTLIPLFVAKNDKLDQAAGTATGLQPAAHLPSEHMQSSQTQADIDMEMPTLKPSINTQELEDVFTLPPLDNDENNMLFEVSKEVVTELFLSANRGDSRQLSDIILSHDLHSIEADVPIDDAGHTALHWAAALGKVSLVADLVQHGANCRRGNRKGESPLVRAVLVTNSSDNHSFGELLDLLFPCLHLGDSQGRTLLHHIALTAGIPGRQDASRYYLDTLLEWAVRSRGASGVTWLVNELVDAMDANGDTALNIAARIGAHRIAKQLVEIGASVDLANRAGLKPTDFGIEIESKEAKDQLFTSVSQNKVKRANLDNVERRTEIVDSCNDVIKQFDSEMNQRLKIKDEALKSVHEKLKAVSFKLQQTNSRKTELASLLSRNTNSKRQIETLTSAIETENQRFFLENPGMRNLPRTTYDADEPFKLDNGVKYPPALLRARIEAYKQNEMNLKTVRDSLKSISLENEAKFKRVVAKCTSSDESKVDDILDDLIEAVQNQHVQV